MSVLTSSDTARRNSSLTARRLQASQVRAFGPVLALTERAGQDW